MFMLVSNSNSTLGAESERKHLFFLYFLHIFFFFPFLTKKDDKKPKKKFDQWTAFKEPTHWSKYRVFVSELHGSNFKLPNKS